MLTDELERLVSLRLMCRWSGHPCPGGCQTLEARGRSLDSPPQAPGTRQPAPAPLLTYFFSYKHSDFSLHSMKIRFLFLFLF